MKDDTSLPKLFMAYAPFDAAIMELSEKSDADSTSYRSHAYRSDTFPSCTRRGPTGSKHRSQKILSLH